MSAVTYVVEFAGLALMLAVIWLWSVLGAALLG